MAVSLQPWLVLLAAIAVANVVGETTDLRVKKLTRVDNPVSSGALEKVKTKDVESFIQKARALKEPVLFSTDDADLQPILRRKSKINVAKHLLAARRKTERRKVDRRKHNNQELSDAADSLEQDMREAATAATAAKKEEKAATAPAAAPAAAPGASPAPAPAVTDPYKLCEELCQYDTGMDGDKDVCLTDCRTYADSGGDVSSLKDFVTDETYNEQGGEAMEKHFEKVTGKDIPDCKPSMELDPNIKFDLVDADGNGRLTRDEMDKWGEKACVPNELAQQIFDAADADFDETVTPAEYNAIGEDTDLENNLDKVADKVTEGEDQYEPVQMPAFRHVDGNSDGTLDKSEIMNLFKMEIGKRVPNFDDKQIDDMAAEHQKELMENMEDVDANGDGLIDQEEYESFHAEGMGKELGEAAAADNNLADPDDLSRDPKAEGGMVGVMAAKDAKDGEDEEDKEIDAEEAEEKKGGAGAAEEKKAEKKEEAKKEEKKGAAFLSKEA